MKPKLVLTTITFLTFNATAPGQTFTAMMSGEDSQAFSFINDSASRTMVTSIQSPFAYPNTITGADDTQTYPTGNGSLAPPWWFFYTVNMGVYTANDLTSANPERKPSYGQTSYSKSAVYGIRPKAAFSGSVSGSSGTMLEAIYFGERADWAGMREFGFFRQMSPGASLDKMYFYWSTNSNCSINANEGYPYCRTSVAPNDEEDPTMAPLALEHFHAEEITGLTPGTTYYFVGYLFWAWDSTYKFRVEVWDSTYSTEITAINVDTSSGGVNYGLTTSGMNGYVTLGTLRDDPGNNLSSSGIQLSVTSIEIVQ